MTFRPSEVLIVQRTPGSWLGNAAMEMVLSHIVTIMRRRYNDQWAAFGWLDYMTFCKSAGRHLHKSWLDLLVQQRLIEEHNGQYRVTEYGLEALQCFVV